MIYIRRPLVFYCIIEIIFCLVSIYGAEHTAPSSFDSIISETNKTQSTVIGIVESVKQTEFGICYQLADCIIQAQEERCEHVKVLVTSKEDHNFQMGDTICAEGGLRSFPSSRNDGEFNQKRYYQSIDVCYRITAEHMERIKESSGITKYQNQIKNSLDRHLHSISTKEDYGMMAAILLGDKSSLSQDIYQLFQKNGIAHIIAISGLHVSFLGMALYKMSRKCGFGFLPSFTGSLFFLAIYAALTGNGVSARRAVFMCVIQMGASILGRTYDTLSALALSAIIFLTENKYVCFHSGFLMSFLAILGILFLVPSLNRIFLPIFDEKLEMLEKRNEKFSYYIAHFFRFLLKSLIGSLGISVFMLPIILYNYFETPLYSVFLNIIVIPLMSLLLFCGVLALMISYICMPISIFLMGTVHYILKVYVVLCEAAEKLPFSRIQTARPEMWQMVLFYICIALMVLVVQIFSSQRFKKFFHLQFLKFQHLNLKRLNSEKINFTKFDLKDGNFKCKINTFRNGMALFFLAVAVIILFYKGKVPFTVDMIDVGQGDCILIRNEGVNMLFDGGSSDVRKVGEKRIYPLLRSYGIQKIDYIFISHSDNDHINGIMELMDLTDKTFSIDNIVLPDIVHQTAKPPDDSYMDIIKKAEEKGIHIIYAAAGWGMHFSCEMDISCLHPSLGYSYENNNDYSAVYCLKYKEFSILMTGDIEQKAESHLLSENQLNQTMVLKTAHHGSSSSSDKKFLEKIQPQIAIISCGINNRYGHPSSETVKQLEECGAKVYVTANTGQIKIVVNDKGVKVQTHL